MIKRIEIRNFQSHKNTDIDFSEGINVLCGESDNGKSAVIRAIKWVCENRPLGTDKLNSHWNDKFKESMSVKLIMDNGYWVERIRDKERNGYNYFDGNSIVELNAIGNDVPQTVKDLLNLSDVNFQFQMDSPYLLSMSSGDASRYLNQIIHLDSIDKILSVAESNKRSLNSEQKVVEKDLNEYSKKVENLSWLDEAIPMQKRIDKYDEILNSKNMEISSLEKSIIDFESYESNKIDLSEQKKLVEEIENIEIPDFSIIKSQIDSFENCQESIVDLSEQKKLVEEIENIEIPSFEDLEKSIDDFLYFEKLNKESIGEKEELEKSLPDVCPLCGSSLCNGVNHV